MSLYTSWKRHGTFDNIRECKSVLVHNCTLCSFLSKIYCFMTFATIHPPASDPHGLKKPPCVTYNRSLGLSEAHFSLLSTCFA